MNYDEYLEHQAYQREETPLNDTEPKKYFVCCNGEEIVFTTTDFSEAVQEYSRIVLLNESGDSDDYAVDLMSCDGDYFNVKEVIKTLGYSDSIKSWTRN